MLDELADSMRRTDELDKKAAGCAAANFELVDEFILRSARNAEVAVHDERYLVSGERFINVSDFFVDTAESGIDKENCRSFAGICWKLANKSAKKEYVLERSFIFCKC